MMCKSSGLLQLGNATVQTVQDVAVKQTVQNVVELHPRQEITVQAVVDLNMIRETAEKLVDLRVSEGDLNELSALTEDSVNDDVHLEASEIPEVLELENEEECVPEEENENGVHSRQNYSTKLEVIVNTEGLRPKSGKRRRKSISNEGSISRSLTSVQPSCEKLLKIRDAVEQAIRVSNFIC